MWLHQESFTCISVLGNLLNQIGGISKGTAKDMEKFKGVVK